MLSPKEHSPSYPDGDKGSALRKCIMAPIIKWKKQWILFAIVALSLIFFYLMTALKLNNVTIFSQKFESTEQHSYSVWPDFKKNSPVDSVSVHLKKTFLPSLSYLRLKGLQCLIDFLCIRIFYIFNLIQRPVNN